ncbi:MAG: GNAT family N-acetyltransferase [Nostoc sp. LLA-1]|nr:GNAT family N-acetyltransferase [Cyanocohniella sp. LLY]
MLAKSTDIDLLIEMMQEFYVHERLKFDEQVARKSLDEILNNDTLGIIHLIYCGEDVVGYVVLTFGYSLEFHGRDAFVDELYLQEKYRRQGLGKQSLQLCERICEQKGIKALHLEVEKTNTIAQSVYRKAGYKDHDRYLLTKWINCNQ